MARRFPADLDERQRSTYPLITQNAFMGDVLLA